MVVAGAGAAGPGNVIEGGGKNVWLACDEKKEEEDEGTAAAGGETVLLEERTARKTMMMMTKSMVKVRESQ